LAGGFTAHVHVHAGQEVQALLGRLRAAGASVGGASLAASGQVLQRERELEAGTVVRVGAALYGQQELVPGTRQAANWYTRIASIRRVRLSLFFLVLAAPSELIPGAQNPLSPAHAALPFCRGSRPVKVHASEGQTSTIEGFVWAAGHVQVEAGNLLHEGHISAQGMSVAVIYHGYTDSCASLLS
jgi:hypothetical protein